MSTASLSCERHGTATLLTCATCGVPICPRCYVDTSVGMKCPPCAGVAEARWWQRPRLLVPLLAGIALVVGGATLLRSATSSDVELPPRSAEELPTVALGQEAADGALRFVVSNFECPSDDVRGPSAQGRYCVLHLAVRNDGVEPELFALNNQYLRDADGRRFGYDAPATFSLPPPPGQSRPSIIGGTGRVNPGNRLEIAVAFDVPHSVAPALAELHRTARSLGVRVRLGPAGQ